MIAKLRGEDSDLYAMVLGRLADNLLQLGKQREALPYLDRALAMQTAKLGPAHVQTLTLMLTKCDALSASAQHREAIETCQQAVATAEQAFGKTNALLFLFLAHTGVAMMEAKQPRDALAMFERAIQIGATDPSDLAYLQMLSARALWDTGDRRRAVELATTARDGYAKLPTMAAQLAEANAWLAAHTRR